MSVRQKLARTNGDIAAISAKRQDEDGAQAAREERSKVSRLSALMDAVPYPFAVVNKFHRIVLQNIHWDLVSAKHSSFSDITDDEELVLTFGVRTSALPDLAMAATHIREIFTGERRSLSLTHKRSDGGAVRWFQMEATGMRDLPEHVAISHKDVSDLHQAKCDIHRLSMALLEAQDNERRRIARAIHDTTAQKLVASKLYLEKALESVERSRNFYANGVMALDYLSYSLSEIRTLSYLLHPPDLDEFGFGQAVRLFLMGFAERTGIQVAFDVGGSLLPMSPDVERALLLIIQEALTNVYRHSGSKGAVVTMRSASNNLVLEITDYGRGCATYLIEGRRSTGPGVGITSMRARVTRYCGTLAIQSSKHGTTLRVVLPSVNLTSIGGRLINPDEHRLP